MWVVLRPWYILQFTNSDDRSPEVSAATLDKLGAEVLELSGMLIQLDGVAFDGTDCTAGDDVRVEAVLLHGLLLFHGRTVSHVHSLTECPLDVVIIGWEVEEILMEELNVGLGFHDKIGFLQTTLSEEGNVTIKNINLTALLTHKSGTLIDCEDADGCTADNGKDNRCQGKSCFLF